MGWVINANINDGYPYLEETTPDLVPVLSTPYPILGYKISPTINDGYPYIEDVLGKQIEVLEYPYPGQVFLQNPEINDGYPYLEVLPQPISVLELPYPNNIYIKDDNINQGYPFLYGLHLQKLGAFQYSDIEKIKIPQTTTYIGTKTFKNTDLKEAKISMDTVYESDAFPDDCIIGFY